MDGQDDKDDRYSELSDGMTVDELAGLEDLDDLSPKQIEEKMGLNIGDRSTDVKPPGDHKVGAEPEPGKETPAAEPKKDEKGETPKGEEPAAAPSAEEKPEGAETHEVIARDGKTPIPYQVLADSRETNTQLLEANETLQKQLDETQTTTKDLQTQIDALRKGSDPGTADAAQVATDEAKAGVLSDEDIAALRKEYPDPLVDSLERLNTAAKELPALRTELSELKSTTTARFEAETADLTAETQELIDADPHLSKWFIDADPVKKGKPEYQPMMWSAALAVDDNLRENSTWRHRPLTERFAEVVRILTGASGPAPGKETPAALAAEPGGDKPSIKDKVEEALKESGTQKPPTSHSDLAAGEDPEQSEQQKADGMSVIDFEKKFENMSSDQISDYLSQVV